MILYLTAKKSICAAGKKELKFSSLIFSFFYLDNMSYFRYVDNGEGPTKLFIGGVHGNEGKTSLKFIKRLNIDGFFKRTVLFLQILIKLHIFLQLKRNIINQKSV